MAIILVIELFLKDENGATAVEYGLLAALLASVVVGGQSALGDAVFAMYDTAMGTITTAMAP